MRLASGRATRALTVLALACATCACAARAPQLVWPSDAAIDPTRFNQLALRSNLPLFWVADTNENGAPDADEVRALLFYASSDTEWTHDGQFTDAFVRAAARIVAEDGAPRPTDERRALVQRELDLAIPTLIDTDLTGASECDRTFVRHMLRVAGLIDDLFRRQMGIEGMEAALARTDPAGASLLRRNWDVTCTRFGAPCAAVDDPPRLPEDVYPRALQGRAFCDAVRDLTDARLLDPHYVVRGEVGALRAVPYVEAYGDLLEPISAELRAAADDMTDPSEDALRTYLRAVATRFESGDTPADITERATMSFAGSGWYVRLGANDEAIGTCRRWARFGMVFGRRDAEAGTLRGRLAPNVDAIGRSLAALPSPDGTSRALGQASRDVDLVEVILQAGNDRWAFGASDGLGGARLVVLTSFMTAPGLVDAFLARRAAQLDASSLLGRSEMARAMLWQVVLHELGHGLEPVLDQPAATVGDDAIEHDIASELAADAIAVFAAGMLSDARALDVRLDAIYLDAVAMSVGRLGGPLYASTGPRRLYAQCAAVFVGLLMQAGAVTWDPNAASADSAHRGAFHVELARMRDAAQEVARRAVDIASSPDLPGLDALLHQYVDGDGLPLTVLQERFRDARSPSFVYSIRW